LPTTHAKVANSGSGKLVIARYRMRYFFKKERRYRYRSWKISSLQWLAILVARYCPALHTCMKNTNNLQITIHTTVYTVDPSLKEP